MSESPKFDLPSSGDGLDRYLQAVRGAERLDRDEELALVERFRNRGDLGAQHRLLTANLRAVAAIAFKYRRYGVPLDELIAEGNLALVHALSKFDPSRGTRFMTYASFWVRAHVLNRVIGSFSMVGAGSGVLRTKVFFKLRRERAKLLNLVGDGEEVDVLLAQALDLPIDTVRSMVQRLDARDVSLEGGVGQGVASFLERLSADEPSHEERLAKLELEAMFARTLESAFATLDARERYIVESRFLADDEGKPSLAELGRRLGVSRERARQLETRAKRKLRPRLEAHAREAGLA